MRPGYPKIDPDRPSEVGERPTIPVVRSLTVDFRWDEKAGLRRDALSSQVIDAL
jgi:hypothetical protein